MQPDHAKPAAAFVVLVVLAAATVGSGLSRQDSDGADRTATAPAPDLHEGRPADRLTPFDPTRPVTLAPRPMSDDTSSARSASGTGPAAGGADPALVSRARQPSRSRTGDGGATGSRTGTGSGAETRSWSPGHGQGKARGHASSPSGRKDTPPGHR